MDETTAERSDRCERERAALRDRGPESLRRAIQNAFAPVIAQALDDRRPGDGILSGEQALLRSSGVLLRALALARLNHDGDPGPVGGLCPWVDFTEDDLIVGTLAVAGLLEGGADLLQMVEDADNDAPREREP